jgi:hypothetical protein
MVLTMSDIERMTAPYKAARRTMVADSAPGDEGRRMVRQLLDEAAARTRTRDVAPAPAQAQAAKKSGPHYFIGLLVDLLDAMARDPECAVLMKGAVASKKAAAPAAGAVTAASIGIDEPQLARMTGEDPSGSRLPQAQDHALVLDELVPARAKDSAPRELGDLISPRGRQRGKEPPSLDGLLRNIRGARR